MHAGIGSVAGHLEDQGECVGVSRARYHSDDGTGQLLMGAALLGMLAHHVFSTFGCTTARVDLLSEQIAAGANPDALVIEELDAFV
jgi:hypothetical protein